MPADREMLSKVQRGSDMAAAQVTSTPTFLINGQRVTGAGSATEFRRLVTEALKTAEMWPEPTGNRCGKWGEVGSGKLRIEPRWRA